MHDSWVFVTVTGIIGYVPLTRIYYPAALQSDADVSEYDDAQKFI